MSKKRHFIIHRPLDADYYIGHATHYSDGLKVGVCARFSPMDIAKVCLKKSEKSMSVTVWLKDRQKYTETGKDLDELYRELVALAEMARERK